VFSSEGRGIAYGKDSIGNPVWVAVGNDGGGNDIQYASDPSGAWTGVHVFSSEGRGIAYGKDSIGNPVWVAVGNDGGGNDIQYASDPSGAWTGVHVFSSEGRGIAYGKDSIGNPVWVAVGNDSGGNNIQYASDPSGMWTGVPLFSSGNGIAYGKDSIGNPVWVAVGDDGGRNNIQYASDPSGLWTGVPLFGTGEGAQGVGIAFNRILGEDEPLPCFLQGTRILTPSGYKRVEEIESGDLVLTSDNRSVKATIYRITQEDTNEETAPYTIQAGALGPDLPIRDLHISGHHAIQDAKGIWNFPCYLAVKNKKIQQHRLGERVVYYHMECPNYFRDNLIAEGVTAESYNHSKQPVVWKRTCTGYVRRKPIERNDWWVRPKK
jgi:hypothetical protein